MNNEPNEEASSSEVDTTNDAKPAWKLPSTVLRTVHLDYGVHKQFKGALRASFKTGKNYDVLSSRIKSESCNVDDDLKSKEEENEED